CVSTYICRSPELMQLLMGISTIRYLPPSGTAGLERSLVSGNRRLSAPPPIIIANVLEPGEDMLVIIENARDVGRPPPLCHSRKTASLGMPLHRSRGRTFRRHPIRHPVAPVTVRADRGRKLRAAAWA